jgi:hypothetical protein
VVVLAKIEMSKGRKRSPEKNRIFFRKVDREKVFCFNYFHLLSIFVRASSIMSKLSLVVLLLGTLLVLEAFAQIRLPILRKKNNNLLKRANTPLGGGISTAGEFYVQLQGKSRWD